MDLGGAQKVVMLLASAWAGQEYRVQIITFSGPERDHFPLPDTVSRIAIGGARESRTPLHGVLANLVRIWRLRRALKASGAPVAISFVGATNVVSILAGIGAGWKTVISERNDPAKQSIGHLWDGLRRLTYRHAHLVTANSSGALRTLSQFVPTRKLALVQNPVVIDRHTPSKSPRDKTILAVGRLVPQKALDLLLRAFARAGEGLDGWSMVLVGDGPLETALRKQADDLGLSARVHFPGRLKDCRPYYETAGIFVLPSLFEGSPNALLEAMACGCAVMVSDASSGPLDLVEDNATGLVVAVGNEDEWHRALVRLAGDADLRARLGAAARSRVAAHAYPLVAEEWGRLVGLSRGAGQP